MSGLLRDYTVCHFDFHKDFISRLPACSDSIAVHVYLLGRMMMEGWRITVCSTQPCGSVDQACTCVYADPELKYAELAERLNLTDEDLMRTLHSLSCAKYKILNKAPEGRSIGKEDVFSVNRKFTDRMRRIKARDTLWLCRGSCTWPAVVEWQWHSRRSPSAGGSYSLHSVPQCTLFSRLGNDRIVVKSVTVSS